MTPEQMFMPVIARSTTKVSYKNWWNSTTHQSRSQWRRKKEKALSILRKFALVIAARTTWEVRAHQTAFAESCT
ncbi:hypothetical protein MTO96_030920 [Rhipicephalus appendiculatus]